MDNEQLQALGHKVKDAIRDVLFEHLTDGKIEVEQPAVMFMAGSPAAGKTELLNRLVSEHGLDNFVRIDADDFRWWMPYYNETNSVVFQRPASDLVEYTYNKALVEKFEIIMDSTFASKGIADKNFKRARKAGYGIILNYVYFDPTLAWRYAQGRKRVVPLDVLKNNFINGRETIKYVLEKYAGEFTLNVFHRYVDNSNESGFGIDVMHNVTKDSWDASHPCTYNCVDDLAHIDV